MAIGIKLKHNTGEITTGSGDLQLGAAGNLKLKYATFPSADGTAGHVLSTDGAGNLSWIADDDTPAGYNNANWDTAFGWGDHGAAGYLTATLTDEQVQDKIGAMLTGNTETLITVTYQDSTGDIDFVVDNDLANYSNATSGFLTSQTSHADVVQDGDFASQGIMLRGASTGVYSILTDASANWNTAFGWGNHASAGYYSLAANTINDTHIDWGTAATQVSTADIPELTNLYYTDVRADARITASSKIALTDLSITTAAAGAIGALAYNNGTGVFTFTPADFANVAITGGTIDGTIIGGTTVAAGTFTTVNASGNITGNLVGDTAGTHTGPVSGNVTGNASTATEATNITAVANNTANETVYPVFVDGATGTQGLETDTGFTYNPSSGILTATAYAGDGSSLTGVVSTLAALTDTTISGPSSGQHLTYNGAAWVNATVSAASAAGSDTYVQFNDGGNMGADAGLTYAKATDTLTAGTFATAGGSPTMTAAGAMAITTTAGNGGIDLDPHGSGQVVFKGNATRGAGQFKLNCEANTHGITIKGPPHSAAAGYTLTLPNTDGNAGEVLSTDGAGNLSWIADDDTPAGYNNANWDTAFGWGNHASGGYLTSIAANSINDTHIDWGTGANQVSTADIPEQTNLYYTDARVDARADVRIAASDTGDLSEGSNLYFTNARADARIGAAVISALSDVHNAAPTDGQVLKWDNGNSRWAPATDAGGIALTDLSVTTGSASGAGTLAYNNGTGVFTFQPADLSSYLTSTGVLSSHTDVHTAAPADNDVLTWDNGNSRWEPAAAAGGGSQDVFKTIAVSGQSDVVADSTTDTLTLVAGSNVTLTTNAGADSVTIAASGGGGGGTVDYEEFKCNYATNGSLSSMSDLSAGISSVTIDSAAGGDVTVNFTGYTTPPLQIIFYGYGYASNIYIMNTLGSTGTTLRTLPGGGSSGSPTAFGAFSNLQIRITEAMTGASRSFGTTTHAWIRFVMGA